MATLAALVSVQGFLIALLPETLTYAASEMHLGTFGQGAVFALVELSALPALLALVVADRRGRRSVVLWATGVAAVLSELGGFATSAGWLTLTQVSAGALVAAAGIAAIVVAVEEVPRGCRAWAVGVLGMAGGFGGGIPLLLLPLAGTGPGGWRWLYWLSLLSLPVVVVCARQLPESRRWVGRRPLFGEAEASGEAGPLARLRTGPARPGASYTGRRHLASALPPAVVWLPGPARPGAACSSCAPAPSSSPSSPRRRPSSKPSSCASSGITARSGFQCCSRRPGTIGALGVLVGRAPGRHARTPAGRRRLCHGRHGRHPLVLPRPWLAPVAGDDVGPVLPLCDGAGTRRLRGRAVRNGLPSAISRRRGRLVSRGRRLGPSGRGSAGRAFRHPWPRPGGSGRRPSVARVVARCRLPRDGRDRS